MALQPIRPLHFYEIWLLKFLSRSPRIHQIVVMQEAVAPEPPAPEIIDYLQACYKAEM